MICIYPALRQAQGPIIPASTLFSMCLIATQFFKLLIFKLNASSPYWHIGILTHCHIALNFLRSCRYNNLRNFVNMVAQPLALRKYV